MFSSKCTFYDPQILFTSICTLYNPEILFTPQMYFIRPWNIVYIQMYFIQPWNIVYIQMYFIQPWNIVYIQMYFVDWNIVYIQMYFRPRKKYKKLHVFPLTCSIKILHVGSVGRKKILFLRIFLASFYRGHILTFNSACSKMAKKTLG